MAKPILILKRVPYGSKDTPIKDREYKIDGVGPVGTIKEFEKTFPDRTFKVECGHSERDGDYCEHCETGHTDEGHYQSKKKIGMSDEEIKAEEQHNIELNKITEKMAAFRKAAYELYEVLPDRTGLKGYPFNKSFDDICSDIAQWEEKMEDE